MDSLKYQKNIERILNIKLVFYLLTPETEQDLLSVINIIKKARWYEPIDVSVLKERDIKNNIPIKKILTSMGEYYILPFYFAFFLVTKENITNQENISHIRRNNIPTIIFRAVDQSMDMVVN